MWTLFPVWFLFIFGPVLRSPLGSLGDLSLLSIIFYLVWSILIGRQFQKNVLPFFFISLFLAGLAAGNSVLISQIIDADSFRVIIRPIKGLLVFLGLYFAVIKLSKSYLEKHGPRKTYETLLGLVYATIVVHGLIIFSQFIFPSFRDLTYSVLIEMNVLDYNKQFRMPGLAGAGGTQVSAVQGLGFFIGIHLALVKKRYLPYFFCNLLLIVSFILTGRTGFIFVGIGGLYWLTVVTFRNKRRQGVKNLLKFGGTFALATILLVFSMKIGVAAYRVDEFFKVAVNRVFSFTQTLSVLSKMYVVPEDIGTLIFGNARYYNNTLGAYSSDLGYIRLWWGYGFLGLIAHIGFYIFMGLLLLTPHLRQVMGSQNIWFGLCFLGSIFILNYKEPFFFARMSYPISLIVIMGLYWLPCNSTGIVSDKVGCRPLRLYSPNRENQTE